jgi:hypothetical protein
MAGDKRVVVVGAQHPQPRVEDLPVFGLGILVVAKEPQGKRSTASQRKHRLVV